MKNHDFDFGAAQFEKLRPRCNFPWVLSNVFDPSEGEDDGEKVPLGHCYRTYMLEASNGIKIGFMGLAEREWAEKGNSLPRNLEYIEMLDCAKKVGPELREQGADMVIAMTHARQERDFRFGEGLPEGCVDMIFAGHDHWWEHKVWDNGTHLVRSGSDFKLLSYLKAWKKKDGKGSEASSSGHSSNDSTPRAASKGDRASMVRHFAELGIRDGSEEAEELAPDFGVLALSEDDIGD